MTTKFFLVVAILLYVPVLAIAGDNTSAGQGYSSDIIISEFVPNPEGADSGEEWVELFNKSNVSISLKDWYLDDDGDAGVLGSSAYKLPELNINAGQYLKIMLPEGKFSLNNTSGDSLRIFWPDSVMLQEVSFTGSAKEGESWCLLGNVYSWCSLSPAAANIALQSEEQEEGESADYTAMKIKFIEILPDPEGTDSGMETVRLHNEGTSEVDLSGWILDDGAVGDPVGSSSYKIENLKIGAGDEVEIIIPAGKFALNNTSSDTVRLFSPDNILRDSVSYDKAQEGIVYSKASGEWKWGLTTDDGEVLGEDLPRTGLPISLFNFVFLFFICYIGLIYEQARSDRRLSGENGK